MSPIFLRREMSIATIDGAVEEVAEEMACPERVIPPPIGVESTLEANGDGPYPSIVGTQEEGGGGDFGHECS